MSQAALPLLLDNTYEEGERIDDDFYETPRWCFEALLRQTQWQLSGATVFDPSSGRGAILDAAVSFDASAGVGIELDRGRCRRANDAGNVVTLGDALVLPWASADFLVGNPPYVLSLAFAQRSATWSREYQRPAALLLRLGFMASKERSLFHLAHPSHVHPLAQRPRFRTDRRGTDKYDVGWFVWMPDGSSSWSPIPHRDDWAAWGREVLR